MAKQVSELERTADLVASRELAALRKIMRKESAQDSDEDKDENDSLLIATQPNVRQTIAPVSRVHHDKLAMLEEQMDVQLGSKIKDASAQQRRHNELRPIVNKSADGTKKNISFVRFPSLEPPKIIPEIVRAAALFSLSKIDRAKLELRAALDGRLKDYMPAWHALFDLLRATGKETEFEKLCLDFSVRFGVSPPPWINFMEVAKLHESQLQSKSKSTTQATKGQRWAAPTRLDIESAEEFSRYCTQSIENNQPVVMDWRMVASIDEAAAKPVYRALNNLGNQKLDVLFLGAAEFSLVLRRYPSKDLTFVLFAVLRLLGNAERFERLALRYSKQFEVLGPDWQPPACTTRIAERGSADPASLDASEAAAEGASNFQNISRSKLELYGYLHGANDPQLKQLKLSTKDLRPPPGSTQYIEVLVDCEKLISLDSEAVKSLEKWIAAKTPEGVLFELVQVHHLLAAYLGVSNIYANAKIKRRSN